LLKTCQPSRSSFRSNPPAAVTNDKTAEFCAMDPSGFDNLSALLVLPFPFWIFWRLQLR
jgi:hypothetical protein